MKAFKIIRFSVLALFFFEISPLTAQTQSDSLLKNLLGKWILLPTPEHSTYNSASSDTIWLAREEPNEMIQSYPWIRIEASGRFVDSYQGKCGNDSENHLYAGTWQLDGKNNMLNTTVAINYRKKKYKIKFLTQQKLELIAAE